MVFNFRRDKTSLIGNNGLCDLELLQQAQRKQEKI